MRQKCLVFSLLVLCSCKLDSSEPNNEPENQGEADTQSAQNRFVQGRFELASQKGHVEWLEGSVSKEEAVARSFSAGKGPKVVIEQKSGKLILTGEKSCSAEIGLGSRPRGVSSSKVWNTVYGGASALNLVFSILRNVDCSKAALIGRSVQTSSESFYEKQFSFFQRVKMPATVGVYGEPKNTNSVVAECESLAGLKFYRNAGGTHVCIGYEKSGSVKIMLVRGGEYMAQRLILRSSR
jgi:hypothetical protein